MPRDAYNPITDFARCCLCPRPASGWHIADLGKPEQDRLPLCPEHRDGAEKGRRAWAGMGLPSPLPHEQVVPACGTCGAVTWIVGAEFSACLARAMRLRGVDVHPDFVIEDEHGPLL